jgi:hypothetical protein
VTFLNRLLGKEPKRYFLRLNPHESIWSIVTWNFDCKSTEERRWILELNSGSEKTLVEWQKEKKEVLSFYHNGRLKFSEDKIGNLEAKNLMNLTVHSTIKIALEKSREFMLEPVSGVTTIDMQNEFKYLQWIQASFGMVTRALDDLRNKKGLIMTGAFFSGIEPKTNERVIRVIIFNLDIFYYLNADQTLRVLIFDDKNKGHGESQNPSFQQIIKVTKPQFYDEIVKLLHRIAEAGEVP